ncbi:hypothetical protein D3C76_1760850 [compost metagenome]
MGIQYPAFRTDVPQNLTICHRTRRQCRYGGLCVQHDSYRRYYSAVLYALYGQD